MSAASFTHLLESLHSSLIDELNERLPDAKPELGLPSRHSGWVLPSGVDSVITNTAEVGTMRGLCALAAEAAFARAVGCAPETLWKAVLKRAEPEFARRGISPKLNPAPAEALPRVGRMIWIPFGISGAQAHLGVGL